LLGSAKLAKNVSVANLNQAVVAPLRHTAVDAQQQWKQRSHSAQSQSNAARDSILVKFDEIMTSIDSERFSGREEELRRSLLMRTVVVVRN
jgi:hypothetical protein